MAERCGADVGYFHKACTGQVAALSGQLDTWAASLGLRNAEQLRKLAAKKSARKQA